MESTISSTRGKDEPPNLGPHERDYGILVFSHLRWNFVWQRPQQFLSRFAESHPVLFVEEPVFDLPPMSDGLALVESVAKNVNTIVVHLPFGASESELKSRMPRLVRQAVEQTDEDGMFANPLLWYYSPMMASWSLDKFQGRAILYDCMDELSLFAGAPIELVAEEARLITCADVVFAGGQELTQAKMRQHDNVHFFGCGVEYSHFAQAQDPSGPLPRELAEMARPIIGWFGVIDERMDYELLEVMADLRPAWNFALVGPIVKVDTAILPRRRNLHWIGQRDYKVLPDYCRAFDVCMMPFALNDATRYINPTKALEYLATGKPVVSKPIADVVKQYKDLISIASTPSEFIVCIEEALRDNRPTKRQSGIERAMMSSWDNTVASMKALISEAIVRKTTTDRAYMS